jgi:hypothetical protein
VTGRSEEYHAEVLVAGLYLYGSGLSECPEKIGIYSDCQKSLLQKCLFHRDSINLPQEIGGTGVPAWADKGLNLTDIS